MSSISGFQLRAELDELVRKDLLGPAGGPDEEINEPVVNGRYIVGILAPLGQTAYPDKPEDLTEEQSELAVAGEETEDGVADRDLPKAVSMLPSSMGMTFTIDGNTQGIQIKASWGSYKRIYSETLKDKNEKPRRVWKRIPVQGVSEPIQLAHGKRIKWVPTSDYEGVYVQGIIKKRDDQWTFTVYLVNGQTESKINKDESWLFQTELSVESPDGSPIFLKRSLWRDPNKEDPEDRAVQMAYRKEVEFAVGHGVAVHADLYSWERATGLTTCPIPAYEVRKTTPPTIDEIPELADLILDMKLLSEMGNDDLENALTPLVKAYKKWIESQTERLKNNPTPDLKPFLASAQYVIDNARDNMKRIKEGISLLVTDPNAGEAFRFANHAMWQQRIRSIYSRKRRQGEDANLEEVDKPENRSWYPFQLAFVLLNLPSLTNIHNLRGEGTPGFIRVVNRRLL